jgi:4-amino-4-deoxy-L-arabinose transferase-like glycosyltransferase
MMRAAAKLGRPDPVFVAILLVAALLRLYLAWSEDYVHDEDNTAIPLADSISLTPGQLHLPLRGENHGALPAYIAHASRALFGTTPLGSRLLHLTLGLCTIALIYGLAREWFGTSAARWAAALMAFNDFYLDVSARVTAHVPHLFFAALAIVAFIRFLGRHQPAYLYGAGLALGLAFYCKEHSALLLPIFFLTLLRAPHRSWLLRPQVYVALALFALVIAPDLVWNAKTPRGTSLVDYGGQTVQQATYSAHLQRIGGLGFSPYPAMFYGKSAVMPLYQGLTGRALVDATHEYRGMNPVLGLLLVGAVLISIARWPQATELTRLSVLVFCLLCAFFTFIEKGNPPGRLDPVSWMWVEVTMIPAVVLGGFQLARVAAARRALLWTLAAAALVYGSRTALAGLAGVGLSANRSGYDMVSHGLQVLALNTVAAVRAHPLRAIVVAGIVGLAIGCIAGWIGRSATRREVHETTLV